MYNIEKVIIIESRNQRSTHTKDGNSNYSIFINNPKAQLKATF